jgi:hypothetical protein
MSDWNFAPEHPITLTLASDARLGSTNYTDDQIWELNLGNSEPPALCLQTTFGLRARICRIFPRFFLDGHVRIDPARFYRPITIHKYFPNYISLSFKPFSSINVSIEYWVPDSQTLASRTKITNITHETHHLQLEWDEHLIPTSGGKRMAVNEIGLTTILAGQTSNISPVLFLTGGVQAGNSPYPSLNLSFDLPPHGEQESRWVNASKADINTSLDYAKELLSRNWEAEFARIQRINSHQLEIITGSHDWNTAFFLAQTAANQLIHQSTELCKHPSFVYTRNPDQGFSIRRDGSDYTHLWNGQTAFDTYYLANFLLPSSPGVLKGLLDNFFASQTPQGEIDWKPGLGGQRSQLLATPLLATLSWIYYKYTTDIAYLKSIFPKLTQFYFAWFTSTHDRDADLSPEWDQTIQTGFEEHPLFSHDNPWSTGLDISTVECPDLSAYLYAEGQALLSIAKLVDEEDWLSKLVLVMQKLKEMLEQSWSDECACYRYRDRDSHLTNHGEIIGIQNGAGVMEIHREFDYPIRPLLSFKSINERTQPISLYIHGTGPSGAHRVDHITAHQIRWHLGSGFVTSEYVYQSIEQIEITGILKDVEVIARSVDLTEMDQTLLLPLWAGIPTEEKAEILVNLTILNKKKFLSPFGLRSSINSSINMEMPDEYSAMHLPWISLVLEGLVRYGMPKKAEVVFSRLMKAVINSQKLHLGFYQSYHSETGKPMGAENSLTSLVPVGLFLKILGVNIISPTRVEIINSNPFPWPVTLKYQGLTVVQQDKKAMVVFPDGQSITVENDHPQILSITSG